MSEKVITSSIDTRAKAKEYLLSKKGVTANILSISDEQMAVYLCDHMNQDGRLALVPAKGVDGRIWVQECTVLFADKQWTCLLCQLWI